jgi:hypothetical protein
MSAASAYFARRGLFAPSEVRQLVGQDVWEEAAERFEPLAYIARRATANDSGGVAHPSAAAAGECNTPLHAVGGRCRRPVEAPSFGWISRAELGTYTPDQLLRDTDVMSMAHSLEVRVPLLDQRLVESVLRLPDGLQASHAPKWLLSAALGRRLPSDVRSPRSKQGFALPFEIWLPNQLRHRMVEMLDGCVDLTGLRRPAVQAVWRAYSGGRVRWSRPWALAVLANANMFGPCP